jgi:transcription antitermination factor NusG
METENVVRFIRFARNLLSIPESEINILRRVVGENLEVEAEAGILRQGDLVEVIGGKLTGLQGRLVDQQGKKQMVVELENVGYSLKISVDTNLLRRI